MRATTEHFKAESFLTASGEECLSSYGFYSWVLLALQQDFTASGRDQLHCGLETKPKGKIKTADFNFQLGSI